MLLTVLVVLSSASFSNLYYYGLAVAGMCLCHVINVVKALNIYSGKPGSAVAAAAASSSSSNPMAAGSSRAGTRCP